MPRHQAALLPVVGGQLRVPLVVGGEADYVNLDYAASAPALEVVAERVFELLPLYASVHRGAGFASEISTAAYEHARNTVGRFLGARHDDVVVFTRNTTDALGLLAAAVPGETVLLDVEHHANLLPWQTRGGRIVASGDTIAETIARLECELDRRPTALLTVTGASNLTGEVLPLRRLATIAHARGARLAVDGAQLVPHRRVELAEWDIDYLAFSGHKAYAPFGAGALVGRRDWLDAAPPHLAGGGAVSRVTLEDAHWHPAPARHEAGSPNVVGVVALARALDELSTLDPHDWQQHDRRLRQRAVDGLSALPGVRVHSIFDDAADAVGVVSFSVEDIDSGLLSAYLSAEHGIGVRSGRFCAHPLIDKLGIDRPVLRASVGVGSSAAHVDALLHAVAGYLDHGAEWEYQRRGDAWHPVGDPRPRPDWAPAPQTSAAKTAAAETTAPRFGCAA